MSDAADQLRDRLLGRTIRRVDVIDGPDGVELAAIALDDGNALRFRWPLALACGSAHIGLVADIRPTARRPRRRGA